MATEKRCLTRLLTDTPAEKDAFGGHERVARSIAEVVQTERGGRSIALEGNWGAGKSTIVNLTARELQRESNEHLKVAVFDMWAHQGDPLRRTVLENLINNLRGIDGGKAWVHEETWEKRLLDLTQRRREEVQRVVPQLTGFGVVFAFSLLALPIGAALISAAATLWGSETAAAGIGLLVTLLIAGIVAALAPALLFLLYMGFRWVGLKFKLMKPSSDMTGGGSELPALITGRGVTETRTLSTQTADPTSVEFEGIFRDLLNEALEPEDRRLVLVLDNLDRVDPKDALSIWSTLQTFLGQSDHRRSAWGQRLWVVIPYYEKGILRLWRHVDEEPADGEEDARTSNGPQAVSFIEKTFQIRFRVPPLLLANWRGFLENSLRQALPEHDDADFYDIYRAFALHHGYEKAAPTPRDLKLFVNQIGALHRERQDEFPLSFFACYVLMNRDGTDFGEVLGHEGKSGLASNIIGEKWQEVLAALHYGVPVEEAGQILFRNPIQTALTEGDGQMLSELAARHSEGFWAVLESAVPAGASSWEALRPTDLIKASVALADSGLFDPGEAPERPELRMVRARVRAAALPADSWGLFDKDAAEGIVSICRLVGEDQELVDRLLDLISNSEVQDEGEQEGTQRTSGVPAEEWVVSAITVIEGLCNNGMEHLLGKGIQAKFTDKQWIEAAQDLHDKDQDGRFLRHLNLQSIGEVDQAVAQMIAPGQVNEGVVNLVRTTLSTQSGQTMKATAAAVLSQLQSGSSIQADQLAFMIRILQICRVCGLLSSEEYQQFATAGYYLHHLHQAASENHGEAVGECIWGFLEAVPDAGKPPAVGNSDAGHDKLVEILRNPDNMRGAVEHFISRARQVQNLQTVITMATSQRQRNRPFLRRVLRTLFTSADVPKPPEVVRDNWELLKDILQEDKDHPVAWEEFLNQLPQLDQVVEVVISGSFNVSDSGLYVALLKSNEDTNFATWCANGLASVSRESWANELESQGALVDLLFEVKNRAVNLALGVSYFDGLTDYAKIVGTGSNQILPKESWLELFDLLASEHQELFPRRAYETLEASEGKASEGFFDLFGDLIANPTLLSGQRRFVDQVCRPLVDNRNAMGLAWLADVTEVDSALLTENEDQAAVQDFRDRVEYALSNSPEDDPVFLSLMRIAKLLGIEGLEREEVKGEIHEDEADKSQSDDQ